jgi:hypothetical protein
MGQRFGAIFPIVVIGIIADLLVQLFLSLKIVGFCVGSLGVRGLGVGLGGGLGSHRSAGVGLHSEATGEVSVVATAPIADTCVQPLAFPFGQLLVKKRTAAPSIERLGMATLTQKPGMHLVDGLRWHGLGFKGQRHQGR